MSEFFEPSSLKDVDVGKMHSESVATKIIEEFLKSPYDVVKVNPKDFKYPRNCYVCLLRRIEKLKLPIRILMRNKQIFLIKHKGEG
jgi:hypothetical protein